MAQSSAQDAARSSMSEVESAVAELPSAPFEFTAKNHWHITRGPINMNF